MATPSTLASALDDLGLVVEGVERVGEGLEDVVVARVLEIGAIAGADRIRRVVVDAGGRTGRDRVRGLELRRRRPRPLRPGRRGAAGGFRDRPAQDAKASSPTGCCARGESSG